MKLNYKKTMTIKRGFVILLGVVLFISLFPVTSSGADTAKPYIAVDRVPALGNGSEVEGHIWFESGTQSYTNYAITMALEVTRGDTTWGPKPTYEQPSVRVGSDGKFSCQFVTGGDDVYAERLYVWLIPYTFKPTDDFERTEKAALDKVVINRYRNSKTEIQQKEELKKEEAKKEEPQKEKPVEENIKEFAQQKHPKTTNKLSICYSPYTNGLSPETNSVVPMEQLRWQLNLVYPYADTVRFFGVTGELEKIYKPAKEEYKMRIIAGCWIDNQYSETQIYAELNKLIELANKGYVDIAVVGSETIHRKNFSVDTLVSYIKYVRERIDDKNIPVCTSDTPDSFLENKKLVENCDVVLCTIYPFFANINADKAAENLKETYNRVLAAAGKRQVIISESGWPTKGSSEGASAPGIENAKKLFEATYKWARENDIEIVFFSEIDEAWKTEGEYGDVGTSWGHFTSVGMLKDSYLPIYQSISSAPVLDAETVKWAEEAIQELVSKGVVNTSGPSLYEPLVPITRGDFIHYLVKTLGLEEKTGHVDTTFLDVDPNIYYYYTVGSGQKAGLVAGVGNNRCQPLSDITRQDMFTLIYRALKYAGMEFTPKAASLDQFKDKGEIAEYAEEAIAVLAENGLILGDQNSNIKPLNKATRAEAAVLLHRVYKFVNH
jgi:exo-beta-1,3-glucanase (GH17 family)